MLSEKKCDGDETKAIPQGLSTIQRGQICEINHEPKPKALLDLSLKVERTKESTSIAISNDLISLVAGLFRKEN